MISAERLILRLEPRSIDLAKVLSLVRMHRLYTALLAVRALRGDFATSAEEVRSLLAGFAAGEFVGSSATIQRRRQG